MTLTLTVTLDFLDGTLDAEAVRQRIEDIITQARFDGRISPDDDEGHAYCVAEAVTIA